MSTMVSKNNSKCFKAEKNQKGSLRYYPTSEATVEERAKLERFNRLLDTVSDYFKREDSWDWDY